MVKMGFKILDFLFAGIWGLTIIDLFQFLNIGALSYIDDGIKLLLAIAGLVYFIYKILTQRLDRKIKKEQLKRLRNELKKNQ